MKVILLILFCMAGSLFASEFEGKNVFLDGGTEQRFFYNLQLLRKTVNLPLHKKVNLLVAQGVSFPFPNMDLSYMSALDSIDTFESFAKNMWDTSKSFLENWCCAVHEYNKIHKSLPIPIEVQKNSFQRV